VWRTTDGGASWQNLTDKYFKTGSVGAITVAPSDANVIYVGMGEAPIRGNVSHGDGVYRSTDRGRTWTNVGLEQTRQIARIVVHPNDPNLVYVAAQGHVWGPNQERGVYRSRDGGRSWEQVLYVDPVTGCSDIAMDPSNPRILFAGMWQVRRYPWELVSGGPGGGLYRSTDGGDTWTKLGEGLPEGVVGKVGVAVSAARPDRVFAMVEAEKGGLFRSEDGGEKWTLVNNDNRLRQRSWYYSEVVADPSNADGVYVLNVELLRSTDGGVSFAPVRIEHGDTHDLWIDPDDPQHLILGDDGGASVSQNGGRTWSTLLNQATGQFYRVATDDRDPYWVYGAQQDNTTIAIPSRSRRLNISANDWHDVGGCESGWIAPKPGNPDIVFAGCYGGSLTRYDHRTHAEREITPWPQSAIGQAAADLRFRFQWNAPTIISPHDPNTLFHASQVLHRSRDEGQTWEVVSPDLTRNDASKQRSSGGPITKDNTGVEVYGTIFALAESPRQAGLLWVGSDDGLVHVSRDNGKSWQNVTPDGIPDWIQINSIEPSPHDAGTAYVAATMYKHDDYRPYLYKTTDYGRSWKRIVNGIPQTAFTRVVREDQSRRGLLFAGTETGLYVSMNGGESWQRFQLNLPVVPITDLAVKNGDLVVATQGRAFWILDDLTPLREYNDNLFNARLVVFTPRPAARMDGGSIGEVGAQDADGQNPPNGVVISYWLGDKLAASETLTIEFLEGDRALRTFSSAKKRPKTGEQAADDMPGIVGIEPKPGLNRLVWNLRIPEAMLVPKAVVWGETSGPRVPPGHYQARLKLGDLLVTRDIEVKPAPGTATPAEDLRAQFELLRQLRDDLTTANDTVKAIRELRTQAQAVAARARKLSKGTDLEGRATAMGDRLLAIERKLINPDIKSGQDVLNFPPALDHQLAGLARAVAQGDGRPTAAAVEYYREVKARLEAILAEYRAVIDGEVVEFNRIARELELPAIGE
jgi:photosystem II stability/assembly factor-like uncharacterized protein